MYTAIKTLSAMHRFTKIALDGIFFGGGGCSRWLISDEQLFISHAVMRKVTQHLRTAARKQNLYVFSIDIISPTIFHLLLVESTATEPLDSEGLLCIQIP